MPGVSPAWSDAAAGWGARGGGDPAPWSFSAGPLQGFRAVVEEKPFPALRGPGCCIPRMGRGGGAGDGRIGGVSGLQRPQANRVPGVRGLRREPHGGGRDGSDLDPLLPLRRQRPLHLSHLPGTGSDGRRPLLAGGGSGAGLRVRLHRVRHGARQGRGPGDRPGPGGETGADRKSTRLNSSHIQKSRMPSSA